MTKVQVKKNTVPGTIKHDQHLVVVPIDMLAAAIDSSSKYLSTAPSCFAVVFPLVALFCSAFGVRDWFRLTCSLLASFSPCSARPSVCSLVPSGPVSALLVPPSGYLVVFATARLSCLAWCVVTPWHPSSLSLRLLHDAACAVSVLLLPALMYSPLV